MLMLLIVPAVQAYAQNEALDRLMAYVAINTTNPPGNEVRAAEFFAAILAQEGIPYEMVESAPGRGNVWARLEGGNEPALVLLHHMDVVPAVDEFWDTDPFEPVIRDGMIYGRGVFDTKSLGIAHLQAFIGLHRSGVPLNRDVIFMGTADEEEGGAWGAGWLIANRPEIFEGVGYLLNEGSASSTLTTGEIQVGIEITQKRPYWLRLRATDVPGHASAPRSTSATSRLVAALNRIDQTPFEPRVIDPVRSMFMQLSALEEAKWQEPLANIDDFIHSPDFLRDFQAERPGLHSLIRNTCSITMFSASDKINVVPPSATAHLDCRILPDQDAAAFLAGIRERIADDQIEIEEIMLFAAAQSGIDTDLFRLMTQVLEERIPGVNTIPSVQTGFTDSHFFRDLGIVSYGLRPFVYPAGVESNIHGNNEQLPLDAFNQGVQIMEAIVRGFVMAP